MKRLFGWILLLVLLVTQASAATLMEDGLPYRIRNGDENSKKIAITMDDCFDLEKLKETVDLCNQYGVKFTVFPCGMQVHEEDRELWRSIVDSGHEIASHSFKHADLSSMDAKAIITSVMRTQEAVDAALGYHYQIRWLRPPFGRVSAKGESQASGTLVSALRKAGYEHVVLWNVSQAADKEKCVKQAKNGCIMLFHARNKDVRCLEYVIPQLLEQGYEMVTMSELLGFDPPETGEEPYVFNWDDFR